MKELTWLAGMLLLSWCGLLLFNQFILVDTKGVSLSWYDVKATGGK